MRRWHFLFSPSRYLFGSAWSLIQPIVTDCPAGERPGGANGRGRCKPCAAKDVPRCAEATTKSAAYNGAASPPRGSLFFFRLLVFLSFFILPTRYGRCACAVCEDGWLGDDCSIPAARCDAFEGRSGCGPSSTRLLGGTNSLFDKTGLWPTVSEEEKASPRRNNHQPESWQQNETANLSNKTHLEH